MNRSEQTNTSLFRRSGSEDPYRRRFVWHPEVHRQAGERCYFYFISAADPGVQLPLLTQIGEILRSVGVESFSIYELFGTFDALVRVWMTSATAIRLEAALEQGLASDDKLLLEVSGISYTFYSGSRPTEATVASNWDVIERVSKAELAGELSADVEQLPTDVELLRQIGAVVEVPRPMDFEGPLAPNLQQDGSELETQAIRQNVKVYLLLVRRSGLPLLGQNHELPQLQQALRASKAACSTIYELMNQRGYLLKTVAPAFNSIRRDLAPLYRFAVEEGFRSQTFPIPNLEGSVESDLLDTVSRDSSWQEDNVVRRLEHPFPNARDLLGALNDDQRKLFLDFLRAEPDLFDNHPFLDDVMVLIEGTARASIKTIKRALSFAIDIEDALGILLARLLYKHWGAEWRMVYQQWAAQTNKEPLPSIDPDFDDPFEDWRFQDFRKAIGVVAHRDKAIEADLSLHLGARFRSEMEDARDLRNQVAHRFKGSAEVESDDLTKYLGVASLYLRLGRFIETLPTPPDRAE